ncbi:TetR family transcriptional regulator [Leptothrix sp. BB-4]
MARPRAPGHDDQREAILGHAAALFAAQGYPSTTMAQVAAAAGLSKAALYHYVADKQQLLREIAHAQVDALHASVDEVIAQAESGAEAGAESGAVPAGSADEPPERALVRALIECLVTRYAGQADALRVLTDEVRYLEPDEQARLAQRQRELVSRLAGAIARWQPALSEAGLVKPLTMLLFGMVNWLFTWLRPDGSLSHATLAPIVAELFIQGVPCVQPPAPRTITVDPAEPADPIPSGDPKP